MEIPIRTKAIDIHSAHETRLIESDIPEQEEKVCKEMSSGGGKKVRGEGKRMAELASDSPDENVPL